MKEKKKIKRKKKECVLGFYNTREKKRKQNKGVSWSLSWERKEEKTSDIWAFRFPSFLFISFSLSIKLPDTEAQN